MELVARNTEGRARQHTGYCVDRVSKRNASNQEALLGPVPVTKLRGLAKLRPLNFSGLKTPSLRVSRCPPEATQEASVVGACQLSGRGVTLWATLEVAAEFKADRPALIIRSNCVLRFQPIGCAGGGQRQGSTPKSLLNL